jgi:hypothetical protein
MKREREREEHKSRGKKKGKKRKKLKLVSSTICLVLACFWGFCIYNNNYCFVPSRASMQARKWLIIKISKQFEFKACKLCNMLSYIVYCGTGEWVPITQCNLTTTPLWTGQMGQCTQHNRKPRAYSMMLTTFMSNSNSPWLDCANVKRNFYSTCKLFKKGTS